MDDARKQNRLMKVVATAAVAFGLAAGSYGIASAATNQGTTTTTTATASPTPAQPWGGQRSDETLLTGDAESKVRAVAQAAVPGGTIVRVETDADGNAKYEAHMTKSDGTPVTVYVDDSFQLVSVETR
jgi:hypothetical protein